jgi:hypothetical protein
MTYQWRKNGTNILSATQNTYTISPVQAGDAGAYSVKVTNAGGSVTSANPTLTVLVPPEITTQPQSQAVANKDNVSFSVVASGSTPLSYQWSLNGAPVPGPGSTLALGKVNGSDAGSYRVVVANSLGSVTSVVATLTVNAPPFITTQPQNQTAVAGQNASFSVAAIGLGTLSYQWGFNGTTLTGATNSALTSTNVQPTNAGSYTVVVSNYEGSVTSVVATLTVNVPATITNQPQPQTVNVGQTATFSAGAIGTPNLSYQWYFNGAKMGGGSTSSTLSINAVGTNNVGNYTVVVNNNYGSVTSVVATLTTIVSQPQSQTVAVGGNASFTLVANSPATLNYQWNYNGTAISGATSATLTLTNLQTTNSGSYAVTVTNVAGAQFNTAATLTVLNGWVGVVTNTSDSGAGSLRQALLNANTNSISPSTIVFSILGSGPFTISPLSALPVITSSVTIDATTQPGYSNTNQPVVQVDGKSLPGGTTSDGLTITAGGCTVKGLDISDFPGNGITLALGSSNVIQGNFIGCALDGTTKLPNGNNGLMISNSAANIVGGTNTLTQNIVVDAQNDGIHIEGTGAFGNQVLGNIIGLNYTGLIQEGVSGNGIVVSNAAWNVVGGTNTGAGNIISSHGGTGVVIGGSSASFNLVQGDFIGTDITGTNAASCNGNGITIFNAPSNTIGGLTFSAANVIADNEQNGIAISGPTANYNTVQGNFIGTDQTGTLNLKNNQDGVITTTAINNLVGGLTPGAGNTIAFNNAGGVVVSGGQCAILGNSLFSNAGNPGDIRLLNSGNLNAVPPALTGVTNDTTVTQISGVLTNYPGNTYRIEFYASPNVSDAKTFLGATDVVASTTGVAVFNLILITGNITNQYVTATATDSGGNTSQLSVSQAVTFNGVPVIISGPQNLTAMSGSSASISVVASDLPAPAYQWYFQGNLLANSTNASLVFNPLLLTNAGNYNVVVMNSYGSATSVVATVTVTNPVITLSATGGAGMGMTSSGFTFQLSVPIGCTYIILASTNLQDWTPIYTNVAATGDVVLMDASATNYNNRFYKASVP